MAGGNAKSPTIAETQMSNAQAPMTNEAPSPKAAKYDLKERTAAFGEAVIDFVKTLPKNAVTPPLISQLIRAGTSVGANYLKADAASTKRDFQYKITLCRKEAKGTRHWLRMLVRALPDRRDEAAVLWREAQELVFIFSAILKKEHRLDIRVWDSGFPLGHLLET
jgi:four helix bundle protein